MSVFGLDIGSTSVKVASVQPEGGRFRLLSAGVASTPIPGIESEAEKDLAAVGVAVKKLHQDAKINNKNAVISLPESKVFSRLITLPLMKETEIDQALQWEAEQFIPLPINEVNLDKVIVSRGKAGKVAQKMEVLVVAAPNNLIKKYLHIVELAGFKAVAMETELIAASRALLSANSPTTMIIDFGAETTDIAIVKKGMVVFTRSLPTAGQAFTRAISSRLAIEASQAEEYKTSYGMAEKKLEGKVREAIMPVIDQVVEEIKKAIQFWQEKEKEGIRSIILTGGSANLPEVTSFLTKSLGVELQVADPFAQLIKDEAQVSSLRQSTPLFAVSIGLAMKEV
jgi:type IV pilus assembly protein PilM